MPSRPENHYGSSRTIQGRTVKLDKVRCPRCDMIVGRFFCSLGPNQGWASQDPCRCSGIGGSSSPTHEIKLLRTEREILAGEVARLRDRGDGFGARMADQLATLEVEMPPESRPLFDLGPIRLATWFQQPGRLVVPTTAFEPLLRLHQAGDLGDFGNLLDLPEPTEEQLWCPAAFSGFVRMAIAFRTGQGTIQSRHEVYAPQGGSGPISVVITTHLNDGQNATSIVPGREASSDPSLTDFPAATASPAPVESVGPGEQRPAFAGAMRY